MSIFDNKIFKNFSILASANLIIQVLSILSSIRLARQLEPSGYGLFNLIGVQASVFGIIAAYGLRTVIIRHIARNRSDARKLFKISNHIRAIATLVAIIVATVYNMMLKDQSVSAPILIALTILIIFQTFWDTIESVAFGLEKMKATALINLVFTILWVCAVYIIPTAYFSVIVLLYVFVINQILKSLVYYIWLNKSILSSQQAPSRLFLIDYKELIKQSNYYFMLAIFTAIQNKVPVLFLQFNSTIDQIGIFNLGYRILSPLQMVLNMLLTALFPMFSRLAIVNQNLFVKRVGTLLNIIIVVGVWGCLCFALFSKDVVQLLYGEAYLNSANVILVQCWYTVLFGIFCLIGTVLSAYDKQKLLALLSMVYGIIATPIFFFGTKYGAIGLAWCFVIVAMINMTYHWVIFRKLLLNKISYRYTFVVFGAIGIFTWGTSAYSLNWNLPIRLGITLVLSLSVFFYLYKVEYKKILLNLNNSL